MKRYIKSNTTSIKSSYSSYYDPYDSSSDWQDRAYWYEHMDPELMGKPAYSGKEFSTENIDLDKIVVTSKKYLEYLADVLYAFGDWLNTQSGVTWTIKANNSDVHIDIDLPSGMGITDWEIPTWWFWEKKVDFDYLKNAFYRMVK